MGSSFGGVTLYLFTVYLMYSTLLTNMCTIAGGPVRITRTSGGRTTVGRILPTRTIAVRRTHAIRCNKTACRCGLTCGRTNSIINYTVGITPMNFNKPVIVGINFSVGNIVYGAGILSRTRAPNLNTGYIRPSFTSRFGNFGPTREGLTIAGSNNIISTVATSAVASHTCTSNLTLTCSMFGTVNRAPVPVRSVSLRIRRARTRPTRPLITGRW